MDNLTTSITIYGSVQEGKWDQLYLEAKDFAELLGYSLNYIGYTSSTHNSTKVRKIPKNDKNLLLKLNDDTISDMDLLSLPEGFKTACFDYDLMIARNQKFITIVLNSSDFEKVDLKQTIAIFSKYSKVSEIQVYEMDRDETPFSFAFGGNPISCFPSLKMLPFDNKI